MSQYVIVKNNLVITRRLTIVGYEVHYPDGVPADWILAEDNVQVGWTYSEGVFIEPVVSIEQLRRTRNSLLENSDYTQLADAVYTDEEKASWATYRQELRDLTIGYTPVASPTYPTEP